MCWAFPTSSAARWTCAPRTINEAMKIAAAEALAALAREDVPDEVAAAYRGARPVYGPDYIIPVPFDPRLISRVSSAVAEAAMKSGVARREIKDLRRLSPIELSARLDPSAVAVPDGHARGARQAQARGVRGRRGRFGDPRRRRLPEFRPGQGLSGGPRGCHQDAASHDAGLDEGIAGNPRAAFGARRPRPISMRSTSACSGAACSIATACAWSTNDRNIYAASMLAAGDADAMVTGVTRNYAGGAERCAHWCWIRRAGERPIGVHGDLRQGPASCWWPTPRVHEMPTSRRAGRHRRADGARSARRFGLTPRVALLASSTFGFPAQRTQRAHRRGGAHPGHIAASISNMTARSRPTWRSTATSWRSIPSAA